MKKNLKFAIGFDILFIVAVALKRLNKHPELMDKGRHRTESGKTIGIKKALERKLNKRKIRQAEALKNGNTPSIRFYVRHIRPLLFSLTPEKAHQLTLRMLHIACSIGFVRFLIKSVYSIKTPTLERELFGLKFKNPVGIAAGLDKNCSFYNDLAALGPAFVEVGSLTEKPQDGNPAPRCFRLPKDEAIINRMGINNKGVRHAIKNIESEPPVDIVLAASITKGSSTPNELATRDFERTYSMVYDFVNMVVLNISCPNVENLSSLQEESFLKETMDRLNTVRKYNDEHKPLLVKLSPDIPRGLLDSMIDVMLLSDVDGIVATNTTRSRDGLSTPSQELDRIGNGGLSGAPLFEKSLEFVRYIHKRTDGIIPIIGVGGIMTPTQAQMMLDAGASLIEVYTGFIYNGPGFIKAILRHLVNVEAQRKENGRDKSGPNE